ncbi:hypothetical protein HYV49_00770 [Candidatus Pacearchaeota archaeon]|nr:hypothetical protein [Candidatus Pacearchaeota archaeon]
MKDLWLDACMLGCWMLDASKPAGGFDYEAVKQEMEEKAPDEVEMAEKTP